MERLLAPCLWVLLRSRILSFWPVASDCILYIVNNQEFLDSSPHKKLHCSFLEYNIKCSYAKQESEKQTCLPNDIQPHLLPPKMWWYGIHITKEIVARSKPRHDSCLLLLTDQSFWHLFEMSQWQRKNLRWIWGNLGDKGYTQFMRITFCRDQEMERKTSVAIKFLIVYNNEKKEILVGVLYFWWVHTMIMRNLGSYSLRPGLCPHSPKWLEADLLVISLKIQVPKK